MNWCVGLTGAAMRSLLPALEGMTQASVEAGFVEEDARSMAAQVMFGTAALVMDRNLPFDEIKSLTPMETVDEAAMRGLFVDAARAAKEKMDRLQQKLEEL
jgi:pyrroline-5-carboxylate reductase